MTEFKTGDKVRYKNVGNNWEGLEGVVTQQRGYLTDVKVTKIAPNLGLLNTDNKVGKTAHLITKNLELVEEGTKAFTFKEIRKGDTIRRTAKSSDGTVITTEGVVYRVDSYEAQSYAYAILGHHGDDNQFTEVTLELVDRPKPKKLWEQVEIGNAIVRKDDEGDLTVFTKTGEDQWSSLYLNNNESDFAPSGTYKRDNDSINAILSASEKRGYTLTHVKHG